MLDYTPETQSLIDRLIDNGFKIVSGTDGECSFKFGSMTMIDFVDSLTAGDLSFLKVQYDSEFYTLFLVYGNEPGLLVTDYYSTPKLDRIVEAHYDAWVNRKQPMV